MSVAKADRLKNFSPTSNATNYTVSATTSNVNTVVTQPTDLTTGSTDLQILNATSSVVHVRWGSTTQTAVTTDYPVGAGMLVIVDMGQAATNIAVILESGSGNVYLSLGIGS